MKRLGKLLLSFSVILLFFTHHTLGSCRGNACPKEEAAAKSAGLLGDSPLKASCVPQQYPKQGALLPVSVQSRILDLVWTAPQNPKDQSPPTTVFAILADIDGFPGGPLWKSDYYGKADSWKDITPALQAALPSNESATHIGVVALHWHEDFPAHILFQGRGRWHWVTTDSGSTFKAVQTPGDTIGFVQEIKVHPHKSDWVLAKARRDICLVDIKSPQCGSDLFLSKDFGITWKNLTTASKGKITSVRDFEWGAKLSKYAGAATPPEAIFATVYLGGSAHKGLYPGWDQDLHYIVSLDFFASPFAKIVACGNLFEIVSSKIFLAVPSECPVGPDGAARKKGSGSIGNRSVTLFVSDQDGDEFVEACLPINLEDDGYNIVHTHDEAAAFILADHAEPGSWGPTSDSPTSDAYAPAYNASLHTLSLHAIYRRDFVTDFSRVEGLPGVFLANQVDPAASTSPQSRGREANYLQTQLSLNGGASWQSLAPPASYRFGQCNTCPPGASIDKCSLHLHGPTSWFSPEGPHPNFYSLPTAPGLLLATGNVGPHLDQSPDGDCTWMSRDGGLTWEDIADRTAIYEIGNHGGIVVMAAHRSEGPTDTIQFSLDQGACFHKVKLPEPILVDNIRISPGGTSVVFIVHGLACLKTELHPDCGFTGGSTPPGKMYSIDIKDILGADWRECSTDPDSKDYTTQGIPSDLTCLLGAHRTTRRRNQETFCANPSGFEPGLHVSDLCHCSNDDVECEFGFTKGANATCVAIKDVKDDVCPRLTNGVYKASKSHLRLVHGNQCRNVNDIIPDTNGKGGAKGSSGGGDGGDGKGSKSGPIKSFFVFLLTAGIIAVAGGLTWTHCLSHEQQNMVLDKAGPLLAMVGAGFELVLGVVVEVYDWCRAKVRSLPFFANRGNGGPVVFGGDDGYEPLSGNGGLDLDPEDHRSPPLFASHTQQP